MATRKTLPAPGEHVVWPTQPAAEIVQVPRPDLRTTYPHPPAKGLGRLRAAPGAEAVRQRTLAEQLAARSKARQAMGAEALPVRRGCRVRDAAGRRGTVALCDVLGWQRGGELDAGHVVRWEDGICQWHQRAELQVQP